MRPGMIWKGIWGRGENDIIWYSCMKSLKELKLKEKDDVVYMYKRILLSHKEPNYLIYRSL